MSLRLQMLQVARLSPRLLHDSRDLVVDFLLRQQNPDGGFRDRAGRSDLYYTVFALDALVAVQADPPVPAVLHFLENADEGEGLDFVHLCCLAHAWAAIAHLSNVHVPDSLRSTVLARIEGHRSHDGGYHLQSGQAAGTVYAAFLATAAYQNLQATPPDLPRLVRSVQALQCPDGGWANESFITTGATNATAAALVLLSNWHAGIPAAAADWLMARVHPLGGFLAAPQAPVPDLLSTATALHALSCCERDLSPIRERCLDFIDSLWVNDGGFYGHWHDDTVDCEYTYYGLLALGHLTA